MSIGDHGLALVDIDEPQDRNFYLKAHVGSINPIIGSVEGGTRITIAGGGFTDTETTVVRVGGVLCHIEDIAYAQIVCQMGTPNSVGAKTLIVSLA